jgi:RNA polymerase sigma-70 factor (ECF subfamily)
MTLPDPSDETLMARYGRGDAAAFELLYRRHEVRIWHYLNRNVRNRAIADELMQEVWFAVARDAARYQPTARFTTWLYTIAHNRMIDSIRTNRRTTSLESAGSGSEAAFAVAQLSADPAAGPLAAAVAQDQTAAILRAVGTLPDDQRDAFLLQVEGDLSVEEIATITQSSYETTKSRLRYARAKLRALLEELA